MILVEDVAKCGGGKKEEIGRVMWGGKLNIDENPQTAPKYGIRGIPTLMIFKNGELAATNVGVLTKSELEKFINDNI